MTQPVKDSFHPPATHPREHYSQVRAEALQLIGEVPLYAERTAQIPDDPAQISAWLAAMPTIGKRDLRRGFPKTLVRRSSDLKAELASGRVEIISTSGTVENRLQVIWELAWWDPQEREAMRLNGLIAKVMPEAANDFREAVLTTPVCGGATCHVGNLSRADRTIDNMLFLNQVADPTHWNSTELERMTSEWNDLAPDGVEADPAYLAALCRHASANGKKMHSPKFVTLTYELPTRAHRRAIAAALDSPIYALYGATEAGVLFMECERGRLHHNSRHSHIELIEVGEGLGRVVVTTLGRTWMPLLRYDLSDIVRLSDRERCDCGRATDGYLLDRIEGRGADCIPLANRLVTPAQLDDVIDEADPQIEAWQLARGEGAVVLRVVGNSVSDGGKRAADAVAQLLDMPVTARTEAAILPEGSGKYRLVRW